MAITVLLLISNNADDEPAQLVTSRPYQFIGAIAVLALVAIALADGYWGAIQSADMLTRQDNPRRGIADQFSKRGSLLDQNNQELDVTTGKSGTYQRNYLYPPLSSTLGYNDSTYGKPDWKPVWMATCAATRVTQPRRSGGTTWFMANRLPV